MSKKSREKDNQTMKEEHQAQSSGQVEELKTAETNTEKKDEVPAGTETEATPEIPLEQQLQQQIDELNDKYLRLYSEFDNYRRRTIKERIELSKTASTEIISELLPVLDDFERAIKSATDIKDCDAVKEGVTLIFNKFKGIMEKKGVKAIETIGQEFNTDFHEAITYIPAPSEDLKNKIVDELEKGYLLGDKVIRYSKVVIGQ
jgi:molecular chaperone GrpE